MKIEFANTPKEAFDGNARQLMMIGQGFAVSAMNQAAMCRHAQETCSNCRQSSDNLHYLAVALGVIGGAAIEGKASELYRVLCEFAVSDLIEFPKELARTSLYAEEKDFPEYINEPEAK